MPTYKTDLIQAKDSLNISDKSAGNGKSGALLLHTIAEYTFGYNSPYDDIEIADIPKGATVVPELSYVTVGGSTGTLNLSLGDASDAQRYGFAGTDVASDGASRLPTYYPASAVFGYGMYGIPTPYAAPTRIKATILEPFGYPGAGNKVVFGIAYRAPV